MFPVGQRLTVERLEKMKLGDQLSSEEKDMLVEILYLREGVLGWDYHDRDMTAISTPLGLLRSTRILQGATNSVALQLFFSCALM